MPARNIKSYIAVATAAAAAQLTWAMRDDPHGSFDDGAFDDGPQPAVLCATAIEYGLIAALL
jgi:hypothetical protein